MSNTLRIAITSASATARECPWIIRRSLRGESIQRQLCLLTRDPPRQNLESVCARLRMTAFSLPVRLPESPKLANSALQRRIAGKISGHWQNGIVVGSDSEASRNSAPDRPLTRPRSGRLQQRPGNCESSVGESRRILAAVRTAESVTPDTVGSQMNSPTERVLGIGGLFFIEARVDPEGNPIELWDPAGPA
jgi:hypothetical protein